MSERYTREEWDFAKVLYEARKVDASGPDWIERTWNVAFPTWRQRQEHYITTQNVEVDFALAQAKAGLAWLREHEEA